MKSVRLLVFVCLALLMTSCSLKQSWAIFGKWQSAEGTEVIEFSKDGLMTIEDGNVVSKVPFKLADAKHLEIYVGSLGTLKYEVKIADSELSLIHPDGKVSVYKRAK